MWFTWKELCIGVVAGVVATFLWTLLVWSHLRAVRRRRFCCLAGTYRIRPKFGRGEAPTLGQLTITVKDGVLLTESRTSEDDYWVGEIRMSEVLPSTGRGHYCHFKDGHQLWGTHEIQVKDQSTLLVHSMYVHSDSRVISQGFIWDKV